MATKLLSKSEYARYKGWSPANVTKHLAAGNFTLTDGKIDPEQADLELEANSPRAKKNRRAQEIVGRLAPGVAAPSDSQVTSLANMRMIHEQFKVRRAKLEVEQLEGSLIDAKAVKDAAFRQARLVRDTLLSVAIRMAPVIAHETDEHRVHELIHQEMLGCLRTIDGNQSIHSVS